MHFGANCRGQIVAACLKRATVYLEKKGIYREENRSFLEGESTIFKTTAGC